MTQFLFQDDRPKQHRRRKKPDVDMREWASVTPGSVVLGVDPSIARCGWCLMLKNEKGEPTRLESGIIYPKQPDPITYLASHLYALAQQPVRYNGVVYKPSDCIIELPFGIGMGGRPMLDYARAVGACEAACACAGLAMNRVRSNQWRSNTKDCKEQTRRIVVSTFKYEPADLNESDAIGLAAWLCWKRSYPGSLAGAE